MLYSLATLEQDKLKAIQDLEKAYNIRLFERRGRGLVPTDQCIELAPLTDEIRRLEDAMLHHKKSETTRRERELWKPLGASLSALGAVAMAIGPRCLRTLLRSRYHRLSPLASMACPRAACRRSRASSAADWYLRAGSLAMALVSTVHGSAATPETVRGGGCSVRMLRIIVSSEPSTS